MSDTSSLYSGMQSPKKLEQEKKKEDSKLEARAELVLTEIAKMKASVASTEHLLNDPSINIEQQLHQLNEMKIEYRILNTLEKRMKILLGVNRG